MQLSLKIARLLVLMMDGESIPSSSVKAKLIDDLVFENILFRKGKHRKVIGLINKEALKNYLANQLQIDDLGDYISALEEKSSTRADLVKITTDSKKSKERAFKGFLVNSYTPIVAELNNERFVINPLPGSFTFIYDYETFKIPKEITVVGVENAKNFSDINKQSYLFETMTPLFVSRYPQNQNKDFIKWMKSIPNDYLHFGDFDMAGIGIYMNEYKRHLSKKASFFVPENIIDDIENKGNRVRYNKQRINFKINEIKEVKLLELIRVIHLMKKGLDQEYYIKKN
ncbi:DUF7281 domain-containing protein [Aestuariibaculum sediminum]|uniref:DUF7281 domain-containing protein n=1 Tax=Aestuariibaculum sediminum TaxID=2770637 RepID=A0A8J6Q0J3_9FLAO|nr:hypothetical protein [Aestuariibaculum sediminum]MBD0832522.1 hypothetical protein [Aestuariibaculum sediminum]